MDQLSKYNLGKKPPRPNVKTFMGLTMVEFPLVITLGALVLAHVWYATYLFSDDLSEENREVKYVPIRSEYDQFKKGFNNIKKRFSAKKAEEAEKSS